MRGQREVTDMSEVRSACGFDHEWMSSFQLLGNHPSDCVCVCVFVSHQFRSGKKTGSDDYFPAIRSPEVEIGYEYSNKASYRKKQNPETA